MLRFLIRLSLMLSIPFLASPAFSESDLEPTRQGVLDAMKRASGFMMNTVSYRGGFVWHYSSDLAKQWGELPARRSQIWVQPPGTPTVGTMFLDAYKATGDTLYLKYAEKVAAALIWGQHPSGGWHYFIDFDPSGVQRWYDEVASKARGWEEFYRYDGNCTYDDDTTPSPIRLLLDLYISTSDPKYKGPLLKALDFVLESQYPNGAWPQRYPLRSHFSSEGHPDYTGFYTFNDDVTSNSIYLLLEAHEKLGNETYLKAAKRGMDFYLISQMPSPQSGWAEQYDFDMNPAWSRTYEPASICLDQTLDNIKELGNFYRITGDRKYLEPIQSAIQWIENSIINKDASKGFTHANFYEIKTNKPLVVHHEHRQLPDGRFEIVRYWVDHELGEEQSIEREMPASKNKKATGYHLGAEYQDSHYKTFEPRVIDIQVLKERFRELNVLTLDQVREKFGKGIQRPPRASDGRTRATASPVELKELITSMDQRGAWLTDIEFLDMLDFTHNPATAFKGIDTGTFVSNMYKLMNFVKSSAQLERPTLKQ